MSDTSRALYNIPHVLELNGGRGSVYTSCLWKLGWDWAGTEGQQRTGEGRGGQGRAGAMGGSQHILGPSHCFI